MAGSEAMGEQSAVTLPDQNDVLPAVDIEDCFQDCSEVVEGGKREVSGWLLPKPGRSIAMTSPRVARLGSSAQSHRRSKELP